MTHTIPITEDQPRNRGASDVTVLKIGGELLETQALLQRVVTSARSIARARPLTVVHGGGREVDAAARKLGISKMSIDGIRVTDAATLPVVVSTLAGLVNTRFVAALCAAGLPAVGLTGVDARTIDVIRTAPYQSTEGVLVDLGFVGEPTDRSNPRLISDLMKLGYVPVVASVAASRSGALFNVNADTLAAHVAVHLKARQLIIAGSSPGVLGPDGKTISELDWDGVSALISGRTVTAGMIAKLRACLDAIEGGVDEVIVADGTCALDVSSATGTRVLRAMASA